MYLRPHLGRQFLVALTWICAASPLPLMALDPAHDVFQYNCRTWTSASGLPANGVSAVAQTGDGYLWLATQSGLIRFDGLEFKYVYPSNFPGLDTTAIHGLGASQTSPSGLWVSFDDWDQLAFCDGQSIRPSELDLQGASHKFLLTTKQTSDGALWATWSDGLARWTKPDLGEKPSFVDSNAVYLGKIQEGRNGRVWLGSAERGL